MTTLHDVSKALHARCEFAFQEDPDTEVGKVRRSKTDPECWLFYIYVFHESPAGRTVQRSNVVSVSSAGIGVHGIDEQAIATILKEPIL